MMETDEAAVACVETGWWLVGWYFTRSAQVRVISRRDATKAPPSEMPVAPPTVPGQPHDH